MGFGAMSICIRLKIYNNMNFNRSPKAMWMQPPATLFAKSIFTSILKFSGNFIENVGGVGILAIDTWPKWRFEIWPFLWFFGGQHGQFGSN